MDSELLQLQHQVFREAIAFTQAQNDYWAIHHPDGQSDELLEAGRQCFQMAKSYGVALKALLQHLETHGTTEHCEPEINRTKRLLSSLKGEVAFFSIE